MDKQQAAGLYVLESIVAGADKGFRSLDTFVGWFIGGTGALFGLLIANVDKVSEFISPNELGAIVPKVVCAFGLILFAKFLGSLICTRAGALEKASVIRDAWKNNQ